MRHGNGKQAEVCQTAGKWGRAARAALLAAGACMGLSGCWFNSSGFIFEAASHKAEATTEDISVGDKVYEKNGAYYVYLPTYKTGKAPKLVYSAFGQDKRKERHDKYGYAYFRISAPYARYLTGQSDEAAKPKLRYDDISRNGSYIELPVVRTVDDKKVCEFSDSCTGSSLLRLVGLVDFVCVDVPVSAVSTSVMTVGTVTGAAFAFAKWTGKESGESTGTVETAAAAAAGATTATAVLAADAVSGEPAGPVQAKKDEAFRETGLSLCLKCKGTGRIKVKPVPRQPGGIVYPTYEQVCPRCKGKGATWLGM